MRESRAQADAHSAYVRAERGPMHQAEGGTTPPQLGTIGGTRADAIRQAIAQARARSGLQTAPDGTKSWVVDD